MIQPITSHLILHKLYICLSEFQVKSFVQEKSKTLMSGPLHCATLHPEILDLKTPKDNIDSRMGNLLPTYLAVGVRTAINRAAEPLQP
jgi:hypothetical protein